MDLPFKRLRPEAELPAAQHAGDAGLDLRSAVEVVVGPGRARDDPDRRRGRDPRGTCRARAPAERRRVRAGLTLANAPGLIDAGYRGEVICAVVNLDRDEKVEIARGDRIAQLVVVALPPVYADVGDELPEIARGERRVRIHRRPDAARYLRHVG